MLVKRQIYILPLEIYTVSILTKKKCAFAFGDFVLRQNINDFQKVLTVLNIVILQRFYYYCLFIMLKQKVNLVYCPFCL